MGLGGLRRTWQGCSGLEEGCEVPEESIQSQISPFAERIRRGKTHRAHKVVSGTS